MPNQFTADFAYCPRYNKTYNETDSHYRNGIQEMQTLRTWIGVNFTTATQPANAAWIANAGCLST